MLIRLAVGESAAYRGYLENPEFSGIKKRG
jgi:hypothetical protein